MWYSGEVKLTPQLVIEARKELAKRSLASFAKQAWPVLEPATELKWGWALDGICEHLEAVTDGRIKRLLMTVPPGSMKSLLTGVIWPAWEWGPKGNAWKRYLCTAHKQDLAVRDNLKCRRLIQSPWYQKMWNVPLAGDQNAKTKFENTASGFREAMAFTSMTGSRGDCLLGSTIVQTEDGPKTIEHLVKCSYSGNVLSYDSNTGRVVYRRVQAVARRSSPDFYRLHFASGSVVECTGDHRIYTSRGYVEARLLSSDDICLRSVRNSGKAECVPAKKGSEARGGSGLLQQSMHPNCYKYQVRQVGKILHNLREQGATRQGRLFASMFGSVKRTQEGSSLRVSRHSVRDVQYHVQAEKQGSCSPLLLEAMRGYRPFKGNAGIGKSRMEERREREKVSSDINVSIPKDAPKDHQSGRGVLRGVFEPIRFAGSPHRRERGQQCLEELGHVMQELPYEMARCGSFDTQEDTVALVERVCEPAVVYDIQVEGTRCFFANGTLVHNCVILDDPHSVDDANSTTRLAADILTFREALPTRINNDQSAIVIIMQRLNQGDVAAVAKELGYEHLMIPMRFEVDRKCYTSIGWEDPRTDEGELMFPERFGEKQVEELEKTLMAYGTASQLQQRPAPREGGLFKHAWFQPIAVMPNNVQRTVRAWDLAATAKSTSNDPDYSVGLRMAVTDDGLYIVEHVRRFRGTPMEVEAEIAATASLDGPDVTIYLDQDPGAAGKGWLNILIQKLAGYAIKTDRPTGDKATRAAPLASQAEAGNVRILITGDPVKDAWVQPFLDEAGLFPAVKHDDQVDAAGSAFRELALGAKAFTYSGWL